MSDSLSKKDQNLVERELLKKLNGVIDDFVTEYTDNKTEWGKKLTRHVNELAVKYRKRIDSEKEDPFNCGYWGVYCRNSPSKIQDDVFDTIQETFCKYIGLPESEQDVPEGTAALHDAFWDNLSMKLMKKNPFRGCDNDKARLIRKKIDDDFYDALCLLFDGLHHTERARRFC